MTSQDLGVTSPPLRVAVTVNKHVRRPARSQAAHVAALKLPSCSGQSMRSSATGKHAATAPMQSSPALLTRVCAVLYGIFYVARSTQGNENKL